MEQDAAAAVAISGMPSVWQGSKGREQPRERERGGECVFEQTARGHTYSDAFPHLHGEEGEGEAEREVETDAWQQGSDAEMEAAEADILRVLTRPRRRDGSGRGARKRRRKKRKRPASTSPLSLRFTIPCIHSLSLSWRSLEFLSVTLLTSCLTAAVFLTPPSLQFFSALPYLSLPPLLLAAVRFCRSGGASLLLLHLLITMAGQSTT